MSDGAPGRIAQSVACLAADKCRTAYPGVASLIQVRSHTFLEIDHEIISVILLPSADSGRGVVSYKWKYMHEVNESCCSHTSIIVYLTCCGLDVDKKYNYCKTCNMIKVAYIAPTETGKW